MTNKLGWCLDGHHSGCWVTVSSDPSRKYTCECRCHVDPRHCDWCAALINDDADVCPVCGKEQVL